MDNSNIQKLHEDHLNWLSEIKFYISEIDFLKKLLKADKSKLKNPGDNKTVKYINHLEHNIRFLKEIKETIDTHEMFMKDSYPRGEYDEEDESDFSDQQEFVNHEKTKKHMKEFRKRYNKLKIKIFKISEASNL
ncbi:MAG: hypothetical protein ISR55_06100 [Bacteroidetes bacterium]|nr:hypothetical protein [Bacteroidota bacterium]